MPFFNRTTSNAPDKLPNLFLGIHKIDPPTTDEVNELIHLVRQLDHWEAVNNKEMSYEFWILVSNVAKKRAEAIKSKLNEQKQTQA